MDGGAPAGGGGRGAGAGRGSRLGTLTSDVPSSSLGKLRGGFGEVPLRTAEGAAAGGAAAPAPRPGASRLGAAAAALAGPSAAAGAAPAGGGGAAAQPRKLQFLPKVPADRPRAAGREAGGARGVVAGTDVAGADQQLQALIRQTEEDAARVEARTQAGRGRGRGGPADRGRNTAPAVPPAVTLGGNIAPRVTPTAQGDEKPARRVRSVREKEEQRAATPAPLPMDLDDEDEEEEQKPNGWLDTRRYYPTVLPYASSPQDLAADGAPSASPLADLGLQDGRPDGRLLLVQLPALLPINGPVGAKGDAAAAGRAAPQPLEALQDGLLGQLLVYASGAAKLRVGDVMFDVLPGAALTHSEQVAAVNCGQERCAFVGAARSRVVVTPDVDALLEAMTDAG